MPLLPADGQQVRQGLGRVVVAAVPGVDDRDGDILRGNKGRALFRVPHGNDIGKAGDRPGCISDALALGDGAAAGVGEADNTAAQLVHGCLKAQPRPGRGLVEERRQLFILALFAVGLGVGDDVLRRGDEVVDLLLGEVADVDQVFFHLLPPIQLSSCGQSRNCSSRALSASAI